VLAAGFPPLSLRFIGSAVLVGILLAVLYAELTAFSQRAHSPPPPPPARCAGSATASDNAALSAGGNHAAGEVLLFDDFTAPDASLLHTYESTDARYTFDSGAYLVSTRTPGVLAWSTYEDTYENVSIQADASLVEGAPSAASGLVFRYQDEQNYYLFTIAHNGFYTLERIEEGTQHVLIDWTPSEAIVTAPDVSNSARDSAAPSRHAVRNTLHVSVRGATIALSVNGTRLDTTIDATFQRGSVALAVHTFEPGTTSVCFDNVLITAANEPHAGGR
jgi:hypothetical protein